MNLFDSPEDPEQIRQITDHFRWAPKELRVLILNCLEKSQSIADLIKRLDSLQTQYLQNTPRSNAIMSHIHPVQTDPAGPMVWVGSVDGQGYLIGSFGSTKVLFDTTGRIVDTGPGAALDLVLLEKQRDRLLFKIHKRDGWIVFCTKDVPDDRDSDDIQMAFDANAKMLRKALVKRRKEELDVTFEEMTFTIEGVEAGLIYGSSDPFLAIKSKEGLWKFYNLRKREMWNPPSPVTRVNPVRGTGCFAEGLLENGNRALYRLNDPKQIFVGQGTIEVCFLISIKVYL